MRKQDILELCFVMEHLSSLRRVRQALLVSHKQTEERLSKEIECVEKKAGILRKKEIIPPGISRNPLKGGRKRSPVTRKAIKEGFTLNRR